MSIRERPHTALQSPHANQAAAHTRLSKRKVPRRQPHQTDKLSPIHRRIASAHVRVRQCTGFAGIRRSYCRISDRREGVVSGKFDQGMVDARAFLRTHVRDQLKPMRYECIDLFSRIDSDPPGLLDSVGTA
jgi:hypothetical protein